MYAIIGSGPAALMAADTLSSAGAAVALFEKRKSAGRKLLVAGSSGLNISNSLPVERFAAHYTGPEQLWTRTIQEFPPSRWIDFIENQLGIGTFEGTSGRYFVEQMKASRLLQAWIKRLQEQGVTFHFAHECVDFESKAAEEGPEVVLRFADGAADITAAMRFDAALFALGGGSWEPQEIPLRWPSMFRSKGLGFDEFTPSNCGYQVEWPEGFLKEAEGLPLKRIVMTSAKTRREGDAMITQYGIEGTPVYFAGTTGTAHLDLRPDLSVEQIEAKLRGVRENLSPIRRARKTLNLCPAALALLFHLTPADQLKDPDLRRMAKRIKAFPLELGAPQPLTEAISSAGGLRLDELDPHFMLKNFPGVFAAGEMLSWDVPTGGFLIQGCVAQGYLAAKGMLARAAGLHSKRTTSNSRTP